MLLYLQGGMSSRTTVEDSNMFKTVKHALDVCDFDQQKQQVGRMLSLYISSVLRQVK